MSAMQIDYEKTTMLIKKNTSDFSEVFWVMFYYFSFLAFAASASALALS